MNPVALEQIQIINVEGEEKFRRNYRVRAVEVLADDAPGIPIQGEIPDANDRPHAVLTPTDHTLELNIRVTATWPSEALGGEQAFDELAIQGTQVLGPRTELRASRDHYHLRVMPEFFDPTDPDFINDPYPTLNALRELGPIHRDAGWNLWLVTRHADVRSVQLDRRLGRVKHGHALPSDLRPIRDLDLEDWAPYYEVERHSLLMLEPPEHTRIRALVNRAFTP